MRLMRVEQFANYVGMHKLTIHRLIKQGKLDYVAKIGGGYRIIMEKFEEWEGNWR